jgi:uncharacterized protein
MLRTSNYTIYVDLPNEPDQMLLVHGYSGAYDKVSKKVATFVQSRQEGKIPKPLYGDWTPEPWLAGDIEAPSDGAIETLVKRGYLTELDPAEEEEKFEKMVGKLHHLQVFSAPGYVIMPTYGCNLRCSYCFQDHMRTNPKFSHLLRIMTPELIDRIFASMPEIEKRHGLEDDSVPARFFTFFGGEPLLKETHGAISYFIEKALSEGKASFSAVSNSTELHHFKDLLGPEKIASIQVTLDGPPKEHDQRRIYADGRGSFEQIAENITMALELGVRISVRLNVDRNNIHQLPELADTMVAQGWTGFKNFSSYTAPIHATNEKTDHKTTFNSWRLAKELDEMRLEQENMSVIGRPDDGLVDRVRSIFDRRHAPYASLKASFCGAHNKMYIFDALGDVYACWERTGDESLRIAHLNGGKELVWNEAMNKLWRMRTVTSNPTCKQCRYSLYCGGGCAVMAEGRSGGGLYTNFCDGFQKRFRAVVAEAFIEHTRGREHTTSAERACDM